MRSRSRAVWGVATRGEIAKARQALLAAPPRGDGSALQSGALVDRVSRVSLD